MSCIVTGGSGMVGQHLRELLPDAIYLSTNTCDLTRYEDVNALFHEYKPDTVVHLAAKVGGILQNIASPADFYDVNTQINSNTLIAAKEHGVRNFLAVLSTCMYPDTVDSYPMTESDIHLGPPAAANFSYAYTKRCMAVQIDAYNRQHGLDYNYVIPCNLYGENDNFEDSNKSHFVTALIKKIIDAEKACEKRIELFGTGKPMRQFMHTADLARVIKVILDKGITDSFNVAPPEQNYSIDQMARMTLEVLGKTDWQVYYDSGKPDGQYRKDVSSAKMISLLGDFEFTGFKEGVLRVYNKIKLEYGK
tara:strand:- start:1492 stop:2409 length:918 start_codon:yes stop_codon:yes gene_type:complete